MLAHEEVLVPFFAHTRKHASRGVSLVPHSVHAGPVVPHVLAHEEVLVPFLMQRSKQPTFPHDVLVPQVLAPLDVLVPAPMQAA